MTDHSMRLICGIVGAVLMGLSGAGQAESGAASRQATSDALFTGPLVAPNATSLPAGHWNIEPYVLDSIQYAQFDHD